MKKLKLIFGLLLVAGFFATIVLSSTSDSQAIKKSGQMFLPTRG
ncbi:hypothetical protein ACFQZW_12765 [Lutibacter aestuarii]|uniref:Uncharacterized protein n=1 Tax=Lutibacter aestuarii TaxID=861111 RepID=A0ABW2ZB37_9FLAO|nr:hypothetical protein [uncultured Lutibacter sp.]